MPRLASFACSIQIPISFEFFSYHFTLHISSIFAVSPATLQSLRPRNVILPCRPPIVSDNLVFGGRTGYSVPSSIYSQLTWLKPVELGIPSDRLITTTMSDDESPELNYDSEDSGLVMYLAKKNDLYRDEKSLLGASTRNLFDTLCLVRCHSDIPKIMLTRCGKSYTLAPDLGSSLTAPQQVL